MYCKRLNSKLENMRFCACEICVDIRGGRTGQKNITMGNTFIHELLQIIARVKKKKKTIRDNEEKNVRDFHRTMKHPLAAFFQDSQVG